MKTAALFATATELGAFINEASPETISTMKSFGLKLGVAYQIYDDCLDLAGDEDVVGKTLGSDLRKGKLTLPILHLLQHGSSKDQQSISAAILRGGEDDILDLTDAARTRGALSTAVEAGRKTLREAREQIETLPGNKYQEGLRDLAFGLEKMLDPLAF